MKEYVSPKECFEETAIKCSECLQSLKKSEYAVNADFHVLR